MCHMLKKFSAILLALALIPASAFAATPTPAKPEIKVEYNAKAIVFPDQKPAIVNSRTLVPIRPIAESLGFKVDWNPATRTVTINKESNTVSLVVSQKIARRNGQVITLDVPAQILNQRTVVPVRFIAEALDYQVNWEAATQTVKITDKQAAQQPQPGQQPQQPANTAQLIDEASIVAKSGSLGKLALYAIRGKVEPDSKITIKVDEKSYSVEVKEDGSFLFELAEGGDLVENYTINVVKGEETDTFEGKFNDKK